MSEKKQPRLKPVPCACGANTDMAQTSDHYYAVYCIAGCGWFGSYERSKPAATRAWNAVMWRAK